MSSSVKSDIISPGTIIKKRWRVLEKIGGGGFGEIYEATDLISSQKVAVKLESVSQQKQVLKMEVTVLRKLQNKPNICKFFGCGRDELYTFVVMSLQGRNLADLRRSMPNGMFSESTTVRLSLQILDAIKTIHDIGFLHRDIKPSNFAVGLLPVDQHNIYMLDFGLSRQYITENGDIRPARKIAGFRGTVRYASRNAHMNKEMGRHDDLWSMLYMLVEFASGHLPWRKVKDRGQIGVLKKNCHHSSLIKCLPKEYRKFLDHIEDLEYLDKPDYAMLRDLIVKVITDRNYSDSDLFDWEQSAMNNSKPITDRSYPHIRLSIDRQHLMKNNSDDNNTNDKVINLDDKHQMFMTDGLKLDACIKKPNLVNYIEKHPKTPHEIQERSRIQMKSKHSKDNKVFQLAENNKPLISGLLLDTNHHACVPLSNFIDNDHCKNGLGGDKTKRIWSQADIKRSTTEYLNPNLNENEVLGVSSMPFLCNGGGTGGVNTIGSSTSGYNTFEDMKFRQCCIQPVESSIGGRSTKKCFSHLNRHPCHEEYCGGPKYNHKHSELHNRACGNKVLPKHCPCRLPILSLNRPSPKDVLVSNIFEKKDEILLGGFGNEKLCEEKCSPQFCVVRGENVDDGDDDAGIASETSFAQMINVGAGNLLSSGSFSNLNRLNTSIIGLSTTQDLMADGESNTGIDFCNLNPISGDLNNMEENLMGSLSNPVVKRRFNYMDSKENSHLLLEGIYHADVFNSDLLKLKDSDLLKPTFKQIKSRSQTNRSKHFSLNNCPIQSNCINNEMTNQLGLLDINESNKQQSSSNMVGSSNRACMTKRHEKRSFSTSGHHGRNEASNIHHPKSKPKHHQPMINGIGLNNNAQSNYIHKSSTSSSINNNNKSFRPMNSNMEKYHTNGNRQINNTNSIQSKSRRHSLSCTRNKLIVDDLPNQKFIQTNDDCSTKKLKNKYTLETNMRNNDLYHSPQMQLNNNDADQDSKQKTDLVMYNLKSANSYLSKVGPHSTSSSSSYSLSPVRKTKTKMIQRHLNFDQPGNLSSTVLTVPKPSNQPDYFINHAISARRRRYHTPNHIPLDFQSNKDVGNQVSVQET